MSTNTELDNAISVLTRPWSDVLSPRESGNGTYRAIDFPPLLDMLRRAIGSSLGKTQSGKSPDSERNILNLKAFALWEHIDGTTRAWLKQFARTPGKEELKDAIVQLAGLLKALHASNQIKENEYLRITEQFPRWRKQIWEMFDPPIIKDLIGACPNCGEQQYVAQDGSKTTALIAYYWKGLTPEAKCQCCPERWAGERALLELGYSLGATVDEEALKEMGVI